MTEEDTFNKLRRISPDQMFTEWINDTIPGDEDHVSESERHKLRPDLAEFFKSRGYDWFDFWRTYRNGAHNIRD